MQDISEEVVEDAHILETLLGVLSDCFFEALDPTDQTGVIDVERISIRSEAAVSFSTMCCSSMPPAQSSAQWCDSDMCTPFVY